MLDLRRMRVLREVASRGSIAAAAAALDFSASAVSQQIATLEREAGVALVERGPSSLRLTPAGEALAREAGVIHARLEIVEAEIRAIAGVRGGALRLGAFATGGATIMADAIRLFSRRHPDVELSFVEGDPEDCLPRLRSQDLDLVLTYEYDLVGLPPARDLRHIALLRDPMRVALAADHPAAHKRTVGIDDLRGNSWIAEPRTDCLHFTPRACEAMGIDPTVRFLSSNYSLTLALVSSGVAVALVPDLALGSIPPGVAIRTLEGCSFARRIHATHRVDGERVPAVARMLETLREAATAYGEPLAAPADV